jgi:hypothetical protein
MGKRSWILLPRLRDQNDGKGGLVRGGNFKFFDFTIPDFTISYSLLTHPRQQPMLSSVP